MRTYLLLVSALGGATALGLDVLAARAMTPVLGSGPVSWAALLAAALGMLAVGNLVGGRWSRLAPTNLILAWALTLAAASLVILSQCYGWLLRWTAEQPMPIAEIAAALALQAAPMAMLGVIAPVIVQASRNATGPMGCGRSRNRRRGRNRWGAADRPRSRARLGSGQVIPAAGNTFGGHRDACRLGPATVDRCGGGDRAASCRRLVPVPRTGVAVRRITARAAGASHRRLLAGSVDRWSSADRHAHAFSAGRGVAGAAICWNWRSGCGPGIATALVVGLGGGLAPRILGTHGIECESIEIDPAVVDVAPPRVWLRRLRNAGRREGACWPRRERPYDLIFLDVLHGPTACRGTCSRRRALRLVQQRLAPGGVLAIQFIGDDGFWSASLMRTVEAVFGQGFDEHGGGQRSAATASAPRWLFVDRDGPARLAGRGTVGGSSLANGRRSSPPVKARSLLTITFRPSWPGPGLRGNGAIFAAASESLPSPHANRAYRL